MVQESVTKALNDANLNYDNINQAVVGYVYGKNQNKLCAAMLSYVLNTFLVNSYRKSV